LFLGQGQPAGVLYYTFCPSYFAVLLLFFIGVCIIYFFIFINISLEKDLGPDLAKLYESERIRIRYIGIKLCTRNWLPAEMNWRWVSVFIKYVPHPTGAEGGAGGDGEDGGQAPPAREAEASHDQGPAGGGLGGAGSHGGQGKKRQYCTVGTYLPTTLTPL
jgi:hypothetical protein